MVVLPDTDTDAGNGGGGGGVVPSAASCTAEGASPANLAGRTVTSTACGGGGGGSGGSHSKGKAAASAAAATTDDKAGVESSTGKIAARGGRGQEQGLESKSAAPTPAGSVRPPVSRATYKRAAAPGGPRDPTGCWPYKSSRTSLRETEKMREQMDVYCRPDGNGGGSIDPAWREQKQAEDRQLNASAPRPPPQRKFGAGAGAAS
jgi:hypothetical protein